MKGFVEAPGVAEMLTGRGKQVEILTPFPKLGGQMLDLTLQSSYLMGRLLKAGVKIFPDTMVTGIESKVVNAVNVYSGDARAIPADTVIIISGRTPNDDLYHVLAERAVEVHRVGDCAGPVNIGKAFREGYEVAMTL
jgi:dimethylamine/trimethylamine dehydrogenase